jgi:hypothetical protein
VKFEGILLSFFLVLSAEKTERDMGEKFGAKSQEIKTSNDFETK